MFDVIHIKHTEKYNVGESFDYDEEGQISQAVVCFMIVGVKKSVLHVIQAVLQNKL